jgi:hypothetical protein
MDRLLPQQLHPGLCIQEDEFALWTHPHLHGAISNAGTCVVNFDFGYVVTRVYERTLPIFFDGGQTCGADPESIWPPGFDIY